MIVVTGATGNIGSELIKLLSEQEEDVRAISRNPPEDRTLPGVEWVTADLADRVALRSAFTAAERVFLLTGNDADMVPLQKNAVAAAEEAGVEHVVKVSAFGASDHSNSVIGVWHYNVERFLQESNVAWTILRPHVFMQNLLDQRTAIREEGTIYSASGAAAIPMVDTRDIAAVAAAALTESGHRGNRYTLTGPEAISYTAAAEILSQVLDRKVTYVAETEDEAWHRLHGRGLPAWLIGAQLALAAYHRQGGGTAVITDAVEQVTGRRPRSFEAFARDYAALFR